MVAGWCVEKETPLRLSRLWQPEPDVMILRGGRQDYRGRLPGPGDVALVVEVSDESSQARDRGRKLRGYARAGIPVYWLVELVARRVEVHTGPTGPCPTPCFRHTVPFGPNEELPAVIDGPEVLRFVVRDILP
jgi:Uma2 family endonuclease